MLHLFAAVFGFGYGGVSALMPPTVAEVFGLRSHGVILGVTTFVGTAGCAVGAVMAGSVFDITGSYQVAFLICVALSIIGIILSALLRPLGS
jgi:MFS family permease